MRLAVRSLVLLVLAATAILVARAAGDGRSERLLRSPATEPAGAPFLKARPAARPASPDRPGAQQAAPGFGTPVAVTSDVDTQAAEPSLKVDRTDANQRIWITAPIGIGARTALGGVAGDLVWHSDDDGATWTLHGTTTIVGGGDSDVAPAFGPRCSSPG